MGCRSRAIVVQRMSHWSCSGAEASATARNRTMSPVPRSTHAFVARTNRSAMSSDHARGVVQERSPTDRDEFARQITPLAAGVRRNFVYNLPPMLRFLTAGESHGRALVVILEGIPAGLSIDLDAITRDLRRRQGGYGRGRRMAIESDRAEILSGVRAGETIGGPIAMMIENRDWAELAVHDARDHRSRRPTPAARAARRSRGRGPGTPTSPASPSTAARDVRDILERASARETAARVAAGALARQLLRTPASASPATCSRSARRRLPDGTVVSFDARGGARPTTRRFAASTPTSSSR